jgi:hypothetical protein
MYREILFNSDNFSRGDRNHPFFTFPEELRFEYFCVKTAEFPNFYFNVAKNEVLGIITYNSNGTVREYKYMIVQAQNLPNVTAVVAMLNALVSNTTGGNSIFNSPGPGPVFVVINTYFIGLSTQFGFPWSFDFSGNTTQPSGTNLSPTSITYLNNFIVSPTPLTQPNVTYQSKYLARLLGYPALTTITNNLNGVDLNDQTVGAIKATRDSYLLLKSNSMSGATFTPNTTFSGAYASANVICKIPINQGTFPYGTYVFYETNQTPSTENMFSYNGGVTGNFDLYFVRPDPALQDDTVDFQGWNFSVTIAIITSETP